MRTRACLIINERGTVKAYNRSYPPVHSGEVLVEIEVDIPKELFNRPQLRAQISVPEDSVTPYVIEAETKDNIEQAIKNATGLIVSLEVIDPKDEVEELIDKE